MALRRIKGSGITDGTIGADDLASTLNLSGKTITLPASSVTAHATTATPTNVSDTANTSTGYFDVPAGTTAQRPGSPAIGNMRWNTTTDGLEMYDGSAWGIIGVTNPTISSISPTTSSATGTTITITGTGFKTGATIKIIGDDDTEYNPSSSSYVSATSYTFVTPELTVANEAYDIKLTNSNTGTVTSEDALDAGGVPSWTTSAGSLGSITEAATGTHATVAATDPDGQTVTFSVTTGAVPAGLSFNTTSGVISGDPTDVGSDTTTNFTITASDGVNTTARDFSMTVTNLVIGSSSGTPGTSCQAIYDAGITSDGTYWIRPGASAAVQAQCASGWTTIVRMNASGATSQNTQSAYNGIPTTGGATAKLSHAIIQELVTASAYNNPVKFSFCGTSRYINGDGTWTSSGSRNKLASWTSSVSSTSYATKCGSGSSPDINNGNGGEWASNSVPWPYQDGTCALNGGFANGNPNGCSGSGTGDQFCNPSSWSGSTGCGSTGWYTVDMYVGG